MRPVLPGDNERTANGPVEFSSNGTHLLTFGTPTLSSPAVNTTSPFAAPTWIAVAVDAVGATSRG